MFIIVGKIFFLLEQGSTYFHVLPGIENCVLMSAKCLSHLQPLQNFATKLAAKTLQYNIS